MFVIRVLILLTCILASVSAWYIPIYPMVHHGPPRYTRFARHPPRIIRPIIVPDEASEEAPEIPRPKRNHHYDDYDHDQDRSHSGVTGPVHTFVKTDKNANYKWGVRHHVGNQYAS